jgi:hypothetical protein
MLCASLVLGLHLATYHFDRDRAYNEVNLGGYAQCESWAAGAYRNSERNVSVWGGKQFDQVVGPVDVTVGLVAGYKRAPVLPMLIPSLKAGNARLSLLLPLEKGGGGLHLSTEF